MQVEIVEATWSRVLRVCWSFAWRCVVTAMLLRMLLDLGDDLAALDAVLATWPGRAVAAWLTLTLLLAVPFRLILGKDFGGFRLSLVRAAQDEDTAAFARSAWSRGRGGLIGGAIIGATLVRESWDRTRRDDVLLIAGVLVAIAAAVQVARWLLLSKAGPRPDAAPR